MRRLFALAFISLIFINQGYSAESGTTLLYSDFMENVKNNNIGYLVEKYNVDIANADAQAAKVFPDPTLTVGASDNQEHKLKMGYSIEAELGYTLELGGKRKARMRLAESEAAMTGAILEDYFRNLRADATLSYLSALKQEHIFELQKESYDDIRHLADLESTGVEQGSIMEIDAIETRIESQAIYAGVIQSEADLRNERAVLAFLQGYKSLNVLDSIAGSLTYMKRDFSLAALIDAAQDNRSDLQAALRSKEVSQRNLALVKAARMIDIDLSVGYSYNSEVRNEIAPAPSFNGVSGGISIPLKFSNTNKGELRSARSSIQQSESAYEEAELMIQLEVTQAYNNYMASCRQVELFDDGIMGQAEKVFVNKLESYKSGNTTLLDMLHARRTYNIVRESYYEALHNCAAALVELERSAGVWDIEI